MNFADLREANWCRAQQSYKLDDWSVSDWACALAGEAGEVCDAVKKLRRFQTGTNFNTKSKEDLIADIGREIADTIIYCDLLAEFLGLDTWEVTKQKFNETSDKIGSTVKL